MTDKNSIVYKSGYYMSRFTKNSERTRDLVWLTWFSEPVHRRETYTREEKLYWLKVNQRINYLTDPFKFIL